MCKFFTFLLSRKCSVPAFELAFPVRSSCMFVMHGSKFQSCDNVVVSLIQLVKFTQTIFFPTFGNVYVKKTMKDNCICKGSKGKFSLSFHFDSRQKWYL